MKKLLALAFLLAPLSVHAQEHPGDAAEKTPAASQAKEAAQQSEPKAEEHGGEPVLPKPAQEHGGEPAASAPAPSTQEHGGTPAKTKGQ